MSLIACAPKNIDDRTKKYYTIYILLNGIYFSKSFFFKLTQVKPQGTTTCILLLRVTEPFPNRSVRDHLTQPLSLINLYSKIKANLLFQ